MLRHVKTIEGYAAVRKTDFTVALSHENCDWMRPITSDDISNAVVLRTPDEVRRTSAAILACRSIRSGRSASRSISMIEEG